MTRKDTLLDFFRFSFGRKRVLKGLFKSFPILFLYKIGVKSNHVAKQTLFSYFFRNMPIEQYYDLCDQYSERIKKIISAEAVNKLNQHKNKGDLVIIISASIEDWIIPWARKNSIDMVLATQIEVIDNKVTGRFKTKNCYGQEKVERLLAKFPDRKRYHLYAYGDSAGDKNLLEFADFAHYRMF